MNEIRLYNPQELSLSNVMQLLAGRVKQTRILHGLTQAEFAKACHLSERTIRNLEAGKSISLQAWLTVQQRLGYQRDLIVALDRPKPLTLDQFEALEANRFKPKLRVRKAPQVTQASPTL